MQVKRVTLTNFRNYAKASVDLSNKRNILVGDNAQGKSNFLEAIQLLANGLSERASNDNELIRDGANYMHLKLVFERAGLSETLALAFRRSTAPIGSRRTNVVEKRAQINGVSYSSLRQLRGRLRTVSFKSEDLGLLRLGPSFRRTWIDRIILGLRPSMQDKFVRYQKALSQRNRLLKSLFERAKSSSARTNELAVWDGQLAQYGALIIKERIQLLAKILPEANQYQRLISTQKERLSVAYHIKNSPINDGSDPGGDESSPLVFSPAHTTPNLLFLEDLGNDPDALFSVEALTKMLLRSFGETRSEEIARRQTLIGPHRDDILFFLNDQQATSFASQGQQRSIVLANKLAELKLLKDNLQEAPVLLLDDVLAELDLNRQLLLMSLVKEDMQTIISTTHLSGIQNEWFERATIVKVQEGTFEQGNLAQLDSNICNGSLSLG